MRKYRIVFHYTGVRSFAREHLFEKSFRFVDVAVVREQLNDLANRIGRFSRAQPQDYLSFVEKVGERDSH
jgi:hypothetical protein